VPGIDPDKDVKITIDNGFLTIRAERLEEKKEGGRSEFRYGSFIRSATLPTGADPDDVTATYGDSILEVRVGIKPPGLAVGQRVISAMFSTTSPAISSLRRL